MVGMLMGSPPRTNASTPPAAASLRVQTSNAGMALPLVYGQTRVAGNLIWYGDFTATSQTTGGGGGGGGKGGGVGGGGGATTYSYSVSVMFGLCEGAIGGIGTIWRDKDTIDGDACAALGLSLFDGALGQDIWGYLASVHPEAALGYNQIAYVAGANYSLGSDSSLPNHNFEVIGLLAGTVAGFLDINPADVIADYLIDPDHGTGFDPERMGDLSTYRAYCQAAGLLISPAYTNVEEARQALDRIATFTNSEFVWSAGKLAIVPYGDAPLDANGASYRPPAAPLYDLDDDDFIKTGTDDPVQMTRARPADQKNSVKFEFCNRATAYNVDIVEAKDEAMIALYGPRPEQSIQAHEICDAGVARTSAQLWLQRQAVRNSYKFSLGWRHILLDPMDIVTITDAALGLDRQWVRITDIAEDESGTLTITAEDYLTGTGAAAAYRFQSSTGTGVNPMAPPGDAVTPVFLEPPDGLAATGLEVWIATAGGPLWGGAEVWIGADGETYKYAGRIEGPSRLGTLSAPLAAIVPAATGPTVDQADTLAVDLSLSRGTLIAGSQADALALNTPCWVDGEIVAFATATQTGPNRYDLSYLVRGAYGTAISAHGAGSAFVRLDASLFKYPFDAGRIGQPIYVKLLSFNIFGAATQQLADMQPYTYIPRGLALASPLPDVANLVTVFVGGQTVLQWSPVADFRTVDYELRLGSSWAGAQILPRTPLTSYPAQGDGTYWLAAHSNPFPGLDVYSAHPATLAIVGSVLVRNVVASFDEVVEHWPGTVSGGAVIAGNGLMLGGSGDVLGVASFLSLTDVLWLGGVAPSGAYNFPPGETVNVGRIASCYVNFGYAARGQSIYDDMLAQSDVLAVTDFLGAALGVCIGVRPQIALSLDGVAFGEWQNWIAGQYSARAFQARLLLDSTDPQVCAIVTGLSFLVDVPDRTDTGTNLAVPITGLAVAYACPFNAGPNLQVTILGASAGDDAVVTGSDAAGFTVAVVNGSSPVARAINWVAQGY